MVRGERLRIKIEGYEDCRGGAKDKERWEQETRECVECWKGREKKGKGSDEGK